MADEKAIAAPSTYKQPSRKGKKAWRKNVDVTEVQTGLEDLRTEVIQGGPVREKTSDELFAIDAVGDAEIEKKQKSQKRLRVDEILAHRDSKIAALHPSHKRKLEDHAGSGPGGKRVKNGKYVTHKELQKLRTLADRQNSVLSLDASVDADLWDAPQENEYEEKYTFLDPPKKKVEPKTMKIAPTPLTATGKPVANIMKPDAGKSYNPLVGDWSALLEKEGQAAVEAEQKRLTVEAVQAERERMAEAIAAQVEAAENDEYATDYESGWESEWDGIQSEGEQEAHVQKQYKRKTPQERNKAKARKEREAREKWERKYQERERQIRQMADLTRPHATNTTLQPIAQHNFSSDSDENTHEVRVRKSRFGKLPVPEAPLEVTLPEDLQDSLRRLKPEGNLLTDRYRNLLVNGKLEVRKRVGQRKQKQTSRTEKWTYKDWKLK